MKELKVSSNKIIYFKVEFMLNESELEKFDDRLRDLISTELETSGSSPSSLATILNDLLIAVISQKNK